MNEYEGNLKAIVEQLERCNYEDEGGDLKNNVAFIELRRLSNAVGDGEVLTELMRLRNFVDGLADYSCVKKDRPSRDVWQDCRKGATNCPPCEANEILNQSEMEEANEA